MSAQSGYKVVAVESSPKALETGKGRIDSSLDKLLAKAIKKGDMTTAAAAESKAKTMNQITFSVEQTDLANCDLIVEAIIEDINVKIPFYQKLGGVVKPEAIFASNTSSLPITKMAHASGRPDRFVGVLFCYFS